MKAFKSFLLIRVYLTDNATFISGQHLNLNAQNKVPLTYVKICPEIDKLLRKRVVCNGRFEAKTFIFLAVSLKVGPQLKWTNDEDIRFINSKLIFGQVSPVIYIANM